MTTATTSAVPAAPAAAPAPVDQQPTTVAPTAPEAAPAPAAPAPAPAPAPAEPVQEQIGAPEVTETPTVSYQATGDTGLDLALEFIGKLGLGPDNEAVKAAMDGNFERLEGTLAAMGDQAAGYERYLDLSKQAYGRQKAEADTVRAEVTSVCHEAAGGEEAWNELKTWAGANADPQEKEAINAMLEAGPVQARAAVTLLQTAFKSAGGTTVKPQDAVNPNSGAPGATNNGALSAQEYYEAVTKLRNELGSRMEGSQQYKSLQARRAAFRG